MTVKLYNTLSRKKEVLEIKEGNPLGLYACGPTVYDNFHIGNARVFIVFDMIRRYLKYRGYQVTYVQNFTDIEDKMINRAAEMGITVKELADTMIKEYFEDAQALGVEDADYHPKATEHIDGMIEIIEQLIEKDLAYEVDGDVYFSVADFPNYGKLSGQNLDELDAGSRVKLGDKKRHNLDFALWKNKKPGEPFWASPWGEGRPGWHIECSAMAMKYLGETIDIHAGGPDLVFPHHENEVAQSEGATGKPFSRYWTHVGYLNINKEKMSKSKGNFLTVRELIKKYDPMVIRFFMLSAHYRNPVNFDEELLGQAQNGLERLYTMLFNLEDMISKVEDKPLGIEDQEIIKTLAEKKLKILQHMDDDFNTADAIAVLFEVARETNTYMNKETIVNKKVLREIKGFYEEADKFFGFIFPQKEDSAIADEEIEKLIQARQQARQAKDWAKADALRDQLSQLGIVTEDTPQGVRWKRK